MLRTQRKSIKLKHTVVTDQIISNIMGDKSTSLTLVTIVSLSSIMNHAGCQLPQIQKLLFLSVTNEF